MNQAKTTLGLITISGVALAYADHEAGNTIWWVPIILVICIWGLFISGDHYEGREGL